MRRGGRATGLLSGQDVLSPQSARATFNSTSGVELPARDSYQAVMLELLGPGVATYAQVDWLNFTTGQTFGSSSGTLDALIPTTFVGPMSNNPGDLIGANVTFYPGSAFSVPARLFGCRERPSGLLVRNDGRPYPSGNAGVWVNVAAGQTLIAAPPPHVRIIIASITMVGFAVNATGNVQITQNGVLFIPTAMDGGAGPVGPATANPVPAQGLLCDPATAVVLAVSAGSLYCAITYDLTQ